MPGSREMSDTNDSSIWTSFNTSSTTSALLQDGLSGNMLSTTSVQPIIEWSPLSPSPVADVKQNTVRSADRWSSFPSVRKPSLASDRPMIQVDSEDDAKTVPRNDYGSKTKTEIPLTQVEALLGVHDLSTSAQCRANVQALLAELEASKDLNKKLSLQVATLNWNNHNLKAELDATVQGIEGEVLRRVTEIVAELHDINVNSVTSSADKHDMQSSHLDNQELRELMEELNHDNMSASDIANACKMLITFVQEHTIGDGEQKSYAPVVSMDTPLLAPEIQISERAHIDQRTSELKVELAQLQMEVELLTQQKNAGVSELERLVEQSQAIQQELAHLQKERADAQQELLNLESRRVELADLERDFEQYQSDLKILQEEHAEAEEALNGVLLQLQQAQEDVNKRRAEHDMLLSSLQQSRTERSGLDKELSQLKRAIDVARERSTSDVSDTEKRHLRLQLDRELAEKADLVIEINSLTDQLRSADSVNESLASRLQVAEDQVAKGLAGAAAGVEVVELRHEVDWLRERCQQLESQKTNADSTEVARRELAQRVKELSNECERLKTAAAQVRPPEEQQVERLRSRFEQQETKWEHEKYALRERLEQVEQERFALRDEVVRLERAMEKIQGTKVVPEETEEMIAGDDGTVNQLRDENKKLQQKYEEQKRLVAVLRRKLGSIAHLVPNAAK